MLIGDAETRQGFGKRILVELRIGSRPRHRSDVCDKVDLVSGHERNEFLEASVGVADREERKRHALPSLGMIKSAALMGRDMVGLVALDFILRIVRRGVAHMTLVIEIMGVNGDDGSRDSTGLGIPSDMIADL